MDYKNQVYLPKYVHGRYTLRDGTVIEIAPRKIGSSFVDMIKVRRTTSLILESGMMQEYLTVKRCSSPTYNKTPDISPERYLWRSTLRNLIRETINDIIAHALSKQLVK